MSSSGRRSWPSANRFMTGTAPLDLFSTHANCAMMVAIIDSRQCWRARSRDHATNRLPAARQAGQATTSTSRSTPTSGPNCSPICTPPAIATTRSLPMAPNSSATSRCDDCRRRPGRHGAQRGQPPLAGVDDRSTSITPVDPKDDQRDADFHVHADRVFFME